jgi:methanogenic corrinoid protein MtbC1
MTELGDISLSVQDGDTLRTVDMIKAALKENQAPALILREGLAAGMMKAEKRFNRNEILISELLVAERAMKAGMEILIPLINEGQSSYLGTVVTGTLEGDIQETEKNTISGLMQGLGLKVIDLGASVPIIRFIETAMEKKAQLIVCTTSLTTFLPQMKFLVQAAAQAGIRGKTKILISGRPVTSWFCKSIDADMYAPDIVQAAEMAAEHCKKTARP